MRLAPVLILISLAASAVAQTVDDGPQLTATPAGATALSSDQAMAVLQRSQTVMAATALSANSGVALHGTINNPTVPTAVTRTVSVTAAGSTELFSFGSNAQQPSTTTQHVAVGPNQFYRRIEHNPALLLFSELRRSDLLARYVGLEVVEGQSVHHLALFRQSETGSDIDTSRTEASRIELFIDAQTFSVVSMRRKQTASNDVRRSFPIEIRYSDYRNVNGVLVPFHQITLLDDHILSIFNVASAEITANVTAGVTQR